MSLSDETRRMQDLYYGQNPTSEFIRTLWFLGLISADTFWNVGFLAGLSAGEIKARTVNKP